MRTGVIGGYLGYRLLRGISDHVGRTDYCDGRAYQGRSKLEVLLGPQIWREIAGKVVIDFGCGTGAEAIEMAQHGAKTVIGVDVRESVLEVARRAAARAGVSDRCLFSTCAADRAEVIVSIDGFEHYDRPDDVLKLMRRFIKEDGQVFICFGPPWFHPLGGHGFSIFPWAHLIFTERALLRWRADFTSDCATRFCEIGGGLNLMTVRRFRTLLAESDFDVERFDAVPIRQLRWLSNRLTREFLTSVVRCTLVPRERLNAPIGARRAPWL